MRKALAGTVFLLLMLLLLPCGGCAAVQFDLGELPFVVSASPPPAGAAVEPFEIREKAALYLHGLFGESVPDIAGLLAERCGEDCVGVHDFRVEVSASGHDWFLTHLTLTIVRLKTVTIRGSIASARVTP